MVLERAVTTAWRVVSLGPATAVHPHSHMAGVGGGAPCSSVVTCAFTELMSPGAGDRARASSCPWVHGAYSLVVRQATAEAFKGSYQLQGGPRHLTRGCLGGTGKAAEGVRWPEDPSGRKGVRRPWRQGERAEGDRCKLWMPPPAPAWGTGRKAVPGGTYSL